jgi:hypothetical protein
MPGDTVRMEVYGKYVDTNSSNWTAYLTGLISQIAGGTMIATKIDGAGYPASTSSFSVRRGAEYLRQHGRAESIPELAVLRP